MDTTNRIQPPVDFPVCWEKSEDVHYHWTRDREHCPDPITPMYDSVTARMAGQGRARTIPVYEEAVIGRDDRTVNTYDYTRLILFTGTPQDLEARAQRYRDKVSAVACRLPQIWEKEWRPEIETHWAFWAGFDLEHAEMAVLIDHLQETLVRGTRLYELHYLLSSPMWFSIDEFETMYCDLFPDQTPLDAHRLLQGFDNKTLEIGRALWRLRDRAKTLPAVCAALASLPTAEVWTALKELQEGQVFLAELDAFLAAYGRRSCLWDWGYPSWQDDPMPVINNLQRYITQPDRDLEAELCEAAAERERAVASARQALVGYPQPIVDRFETLLRAAQVALVLTENHTYYLDFNGFGWIRRVILEFGKRFAADGRLNGMDDVFYLRLTELQAMAADPGMDLGDLATARRAELMRWAAYNEPMELGTRPTAPAGIYSPDGRRMMRYVGGLVTEMPVFEPEAGLLYGQPGSAGIVRGTARVIHSLSEAQRLQPGEILVTTTTAPPWTPLFLTAAGVVTDAGGLLSHGAVVSREYRIPAVVGTGRATSLIADGQTIEVDGSKGLVRLL